MKRRANAKDREREREQRKAKWSVSDREKEREKEKGKENYKKPVLSPHLTKAINATNNKNKGTRVKTTE